LGKRGKQPMPTALKILSAGRGRRPKAANEPQPSAQTPAMPEWLNAEAAAEWGRIVPELEAMGLLTLVDRATLATYCAAWSELHDATRTLDTEGRIIEVEVFARDSGEKVGTRKTIHPAVRLQREAFRLVKQFLGEFGLSPSSRTRLTVPKKQDEADPLQALIDRQRA
jgi:P27 family predicted phage terminase small subunit